VKRHHLAALALLATAGSWGATFVLVKSVIQRIAPEPFLFWRFTLAGLILCAVAAARGRFTRELLKPGIVLGILIFVGYWGQTRGLMVISPSRSALLTGLYVVLVPFFQWRTSGRPKLTAWLAALLALAALMWGQAHVTATEAAVILSFEPVAAALVSIAFYGEPLTAAFFVGAALIVGAMVLSQV
jgi:drug/metabolite transporter (DMT)-like permease